VTWDTYSSKEVSNAESGGGAPLSSVTEDV